ncbi:MAG: winged helix-turn-helix domain-containing protein [Actinobacteria bacterium]|nr:winged helix-turn-helix domain-containing protein [Actinomycetota bacterium]
MFKLLIADKELERAENFAENLNRHGFSAAAIKDKTSPLKKYIKRHSPDALLILHSFSEKKTLSLISQSKKNNVPVIFICKKDSCCPRLIKVLADTILEVSDYSEFNPTYASILEEKINIIKHEDAAEKGICYGMFYADTVKNIIYYGKKRLDLTPTEFQIMLLLIMAKGEVVGKNEIMKQIWGTASLNTNSLSVHIQKLKKSLSAYTKKYVISTIRGKGYKLDKVSY